MFFGSYPITPASPLLHHLARLKEFGITTFQAEDEIAAICAARLCFDVFRILITQPISASLHGAA